MVQGVCRFPNMEVYGLEVHEVLIWVFSKPLLSPVFEIFIVHLFSQVCASYLCKKKRSPSNCKKHKSPMQAASQTHQDISCPPCTVQLRFINKLEVLNYMVHLCNQLKCIIFSRMSSFTCCIARYLNCGMYTIGPWV